MLIADLLLENGHVALDPDSSPIAASLALRDGRVLTIGTTGDVRAHKGVGTRVIDLRGRTVIPGLVDSHVRALDGGLFYNLELRWDGMPSLAEALRRLAEQARRTPPSRWLRVVGAWTELQFAEGRLPTLEEVNAAAPDTPVLILHLHGRAMANRAALSALGITRESPDPAFGEMKRDPSGNPIGFFVGRSEPMAAGADAGAVRDAMSDRSLLLEAMLRRVPELSHDEQVNSSRHFMRELNRFGVTSVVDARGLLPDENETNGAIEELDENRQLTVRFAYTNHTHHSRALRDEFRKWSELVRPGQLDGFTARGRGAHGPASYNPWIAIHWLVTGKTVCGTAFDGDSTAHAPERRLSRAQALALFTTHSARILGDDAERGVIAVGKPADLAVLSEDYFSMPDDGIKHLESVLTILGGRVVHASADLAPLAPSIPPAAPSWSPVASYGGYPSRVAGSSSTRRHDGPGLYRTIPASSEPFSRMGNWGSSVDCWF